MERTDQELIELYLKGNEDGLHTLIARYLRIVYNFSYRFAGNREDAEDITQETFLKVWKSLKRYNPETAFRAWLFTVARNTASDFLRKRKKSPLIEFERDDADALAEQIADISPLPNNIVERKEDAQIAAGAIYKLSANARAVMRFRYNQDLTFREIATVLKKPLNTIKSQHRRALHQLQRFLADYSDGC